MPHRKVEKEGVVIFLGSKRRLSKVPGAEPSGEMGDEKLHAVVARSRF